MLRHLVVSYSKRIRFMAGTVTGLVAEDTDAMRIKSVTVTNVEDRNSVEIPAALVVGMCSVPHLVT